MPATQVRIEIPSLIAHFVSKLWHPANSDEQIYQDNELSRMVTVAIVEGDYGAQRRFGFIRGNINMRKPFTYLVCEF